MDLVKITDLVNQLGISSRSLRYYEQTGLIRPVRPGDEKYRYYDAENIERLKQIMVLRKMEIPIKDIIRIYESDDMSVVVETFVGRIRAIDDEVDALTELRHVVNEFLQAMLQNGVTKISALPLLYEKMEKRLDSLERSKTMSYQDLSALSDKLAKPVNPAVIQLPPMRVLSSGADTEGFHRWVQSKGLPAANPGQHERFELQDEILLKVPDGFVSDGAYPERDFDGGLYAAANVYLDEDLGQQFRALADGFDGNKFYEMDYSRAPMLENLLSPDEKRELVSLLAPVKKRFADPALFDAPEEAEGISVEEIETANPVLWEADVPLNSITPVNGPHYRVMENGEAEYICWIGTRVLNTNVEVRVPFRVDIEFRIDFDGARFGYGDSEGSMRFYHGFELSYPFGVNMDNRPDTAGEAIRFHQPVFRDAYRFPKRGKINRDGYNRVTWIVGEKHLAVIINGEARYCGVNFPYMGLDLSGGATLPVIIGGDGQTTKYIKGICVSQLALSAKNKIKEGEIAMITKRSNNIIPIIHRLVTDEYGENYWFNGCAKYVMECLGEKDYDYWFFAGITGDLFTQHYTYTKYSGDALSCYMMEEDMGGNPVKFVEDIFAKCGYAATYVSNQDLQKNTEMYLNTLTAYIDKGIPVIAWGTPLVGVFVGYEDYGNVLLYITGNNNQPERVSLQKIIYGEVEKSQYEYRSQFGGWIFVGQKKENLPLAEIYRKAICEIPKYMSVKTDICCFGPEAFRAWARDIENGKFDGMTTGEFDAWAYYTNYVCVLSTNGSCCHEFLKRARELNPDMGFLEEVSALYHRMAEMWGGDNNQNDPDNLEALGGGFNISLEVLQDKEKRGKIAAKLREFAVCANEAVRVISENIKGLE